MLLLKLPQLGVYVKCSAKIGLPLLVPILRQIPTGVQENKQETHSQIQFNNAFSPFTGTGASIYQFRN